MLSLKSTDSFEPLYVPFSFCPCVDLWFCKLQRSFSLEILELFTVCWYIVVSQLAIHDSLKDDLILKTKQCNNEFWCAFNYWNSLSKELNMRRNALSVRVSVVSVCDWLSIIYYHVIRFSVHVRLRRWNVLHKAALSAWWKINEMFQICKIYFVASEKTFISAIAGATAHGH